MVNNALSAFWMTPPAGITVLPTLTMSVRCVMVPAMGERISVHEYCSRARSCAARAPSSSYLSVSKAMALTRPVF